MDVFLLGTVLLIAFVYSAFLIYIWTNDKK